MESDSRRSCQATENDQYLPMDNPRASIVKMIHPASRPASISTMRVNF